MLKNVICASIASVILLGALFEKSAAADSLFNSGYTEVEATDPVTGQAVRAALWYPSRTYPQDNFCKFAPINAGNPVPITNLHDTRIKAAVLLAPLTAQFSDQTLSTIKTPLYLMQAEFDQVLTEPFHAKRLELSGANVHEVWKIENAQHYSFIAPFPERMRGEVGDIAKDHQGFNRKKMHVVMNERIITFFKKNI